MTTDDIQNFFVITCDDMVDMNFIECINAIKATLHKKQHSAYSFFVQKDSNISLREGGQKTGTVIYSFVYIKIEV